MGADAERAKAAEAVRWDEDTAEAEVVPADAYGVERCARP